MSAIKMQAEPSDEVRRALAWAEDAACCRRACPTTRPGGFGTEALSDNNLGQVAGTCQRESDGPLRGFIATRAE
jgi:hypothetical protein